MDHASELPRIFAYHLLEEMTNGFSEDRELGRGTYGKVYLGLHKDGENIAVKMLHPMIALDDELFEKEYHNLESLQHQNIVRLVGYCNETKREFVSCKGKRVLCEVTHKALCFEYMQNGSLDNYLSDESGGHSWHSRYAIIKGICKGLQYLHEELRPPIFHLDIKPANILLDKNMVAKIADFGLSRLMGAEQTCFTASAIGTIGYMPPEYINRQVISNKFDIFSLGVLIIKIMAGHAGYSQSADISSQEFIDLVHGKWKNILQETSVDPTDSYCKQVKKCITIALTCVDADRHKRPTIGNIINELNEAETIIQFPDGSQNTPGSSLDQVGWKTDRIKEEELKRAWDGLHNMEKTHMGKPKTQEDLAQEANTFLNLYFKDSSILQRFKCRLSLFGMYVGPTCYIYNATGDALYLVASDDIYFDDSDERDGDDSDGNAHTVIGKYNRRGYQTVIGNGYWVSTRTLSTSLPVAVVYRGKNRDGEDHDYLLAWRSPENGFSRNKCYCEIGAIDNFQKVMPSLERKLLNSGYYSSAKLDGCEIQAKIGTSIVPGFTAIISYC